MTDKSELIVRPTHDMGGRTPGGPVTRDDHEMTPFEKTCHALLNVPDAHKLVNTEEKRRGVESLGAEMVGKLTYYERWIVAFANILFQKGILTPSDLARKMDEVAARLPAAPSDPAAGVPSP